MKFSLREEGISCCQVQKPGFETIKAEISEYSSWKNMSVRTRSHNIRPIYVVESI